jgi:transcriptional regulator with XRE-family HTH domain
MPRPRTVEARSLRHAALGQAIASFIRERKLTPDTVARESGLATEQVGIFIRGQGNPTYSTLLRLCIGLHVELTELHARADELLQERLEGDI